MNFCPNKIPEDVQKVGLYFGSFNPIHLGHVSLANWVLDHSYLDEIWLVLSPRNPFKPQSMLMPDEFRLELAELAVQDYPRLRICDIELSLPKPSYTIITLEHLSAAYPLLDFTLLMGADNVKDFNKWQDYQRILEHYSVMVYPRPGVDLSQDLKNYPSMQVIDNAPTFPISSTQIRNLKAEGKDVRPYLPPSVADRYIAY